MLFSPPSLVPELSDWKPPLPTAMNSNNRVEEIPLEPLCVVDGLSNLSDYMNLSEDAMNFVTEARGNRADLVAGLKSVYPDLLAMGINILIHKLEVQRLGRDSNEGDEIIRRDDIKRAFQHSLSKTCSQTEGIIFWLDWSRDNADLDIFTSRPPILPDLSGLEDHISYANETEIGNDGNDGNEEVDDEEEGAHISASAKTVKNAKIIVSVCKNMLKLVESTAIAAPKYSATVRPTIQGTVVLLRYNNLVARI